MNNLVKTGLVLLVMTSAFTVSAKQDKPVQAQAKEQAQALNQQAMARELEARKKQFEEREARMSADRKAAKEKIQKLPEKYKH